MATNLHPPKGAANVSVGTIVQFAFILLAAFAVFCFVSSAQKDQWRASCTPLCVMNPAYAGNDRAAPDFELPDMNGAPVRLSSYRGRTVFLSFWTKTCGPCLEEIPSIVELAKLAKGRTDIAVLTVSTDDGPAEVRDTLKVAAGGEVPFPVLFDPEGKIVRERYGTRLFPEMWIIDPQGIIRARFDGARDWSTSLVVRIGEMVQKPLGCPIEFWKGLPRGPQAGLCQDDS